MGFFRRITDRMRRRRADRRRRAEARRFLDRVFADPERLRGTSLRPEHRSRADLLDCEFAGDRVTAIVFGILRHPRPHPFSRQFHEVLEFYRVDVDQRTPPERVKGVNLSRARGRDGEPSGFGPGV